jgi:hypothetical protein
MGLVPRKVLQNAQPHVCVCVGHSGKAPCGSDAAVFELGKPTAKPIRQRLQAADGLHADQCRVGQSLTHSLRPVGRVVTDLDRMSEPKCSLMRYAKRLGARMILPPITNSRTSCSAGAIGDWLRSLVSHKRFHTVIEPTQRLQHYRFGSNCIAAGSAKWLGCTRRR